MQKDTFGIEFHPTAKDRREMQVRKQAEKEDKQIIFYVQPLHHTFSHSSKVVMLEKENPVELKIPVKKRC